MNNGESGNYGDFDPTTFRMEEEPVKPDLKDIAAEGEGVEVSPVDHEIKKNPEKRGNVEARISPEEYAQTLERILTGPERERLLDKLNRILEAIKEIEPKKRAEIIGVLGETFQELHRSSDSLEEAYETIEPFLDDILGELEAKK